MAITQQRRNITHTHILRVGPISVGCRGRFVLRLLGPDAAECHPTLQVTAVSPMTLRMNVAS